VKIRFRGVRGSIPVPGPETNRYGGNTACVEVRPEGGPLLIVDAGTGIRHLGKELVQGEFGAGRGTVHLLISHTHWDHIQGLPYFAPLYTAGTRVCLYGRQRDDRNLRAIFRTQTDEHYFPIGLDEVQAQVVYRELADGAAFEIGPVRVNCARLNHPWIALAYRIEADGAAVVYASDTAPFSELLLVREFIHRPPRPGEPPPPAEARKLRRLRDGLVRLCAGADLVIYDTMFKPDEYRRLPHWGHSTPDSALDIARAAGARALVLYHHAPERTDDEIDAELARVRALAGAEIEVMAAAEGPLLEVGRR
jgi:phosphoribosyl 1,2-cyclic phosphodiesterase